MHSLSRFFRRAALLGLLPFMASATAAAPVAPDRHHAVVAQVSYLLLENFHLASRPIDLNLAEEWLEGHLDLLDSERHFFTAGDVATFRAMIPDLPDSAHQMPADVSPAFQIHARYRQRVAERVAFATQMLGSEIHLNRTGVAYQRDRSEAAWEMDSAALDQVWTDRITDQVILRVLAGDDQEKARESLAKRYGRMATDVNDYDANDVLEGWVAALGQVYDPHTIWFKPSAKDDFDIQMSDRLEGIGATLRTDGEYTRVVSLVPGGPADMHGMLQPDDRIVSVSQAGDEPVDIVGMRIDRVVKLIRGAKGTDVVLTVIPADAPSEATMQEVRITRDEVVIEAASAKLEVREIGDRKVAVLDVPSFYQDVRRVGREYEVVRSTAADVEKLLAELGPNGADAVLVDLRTNGGGALSQAIELTGLFIDKGPVVQVQSQRGPGRTREVLNDEVRGVAWSGPVAVLTSAYSASASEIFAGVLQDYGRGLIIGGEATHGKGTVQELVGLSPMIARFGGDASRDAGAFKYTTSQFYRITGKSTQRVGVVPDVVVPSPFDGLDGREGDLDNALPYDEIAPARFTPAASSAADLPDLRARSAKRVASSNAFQMMAELRETRDKLDGAPTSLDLNERKQEQSVWDTLEEKAEAAGLDGEQDVVLDEAIQVIVDWSKQSSGGK
ncbi:MAG: tail-specific protease [Deltaproteobacteria bacterium]|nr:tail-specific protease [Deltaproteobacteria bacterium]